MCGMITSVSQNQEYLADYVDYFGTAAQLRVFTRKSIVYSELGWNALL